MTSTPSFDRAVPGELGARVAARALDVVVLVVIDFGLGKLIGFGFAWLVIGSAIVLAYFVLSDTVGGTTLGKHLLGLRVIGSDGSKPSLRQALIRESFTVVGAVPFVGPFLALVAWVWIALTIRSSPLRQGKHDMLAGGTRVIRVFEAPRRDEA